MDTNIYDIDQGKTYLSFLKDEYILLQNQYEDFDKRSLTIKGWIASGSVAALSISLGQNIKTPELVPVFVIIISLVFWYLETKWKMFQYALSYRIRIIEAHFRNDPDVIVKSPAPFQIYHSWFESYAGDLPLYAYEKRPRSSLRRHWEVARQPFVALLYITIIIISLVTLLLRL